MSRLVKSILFGLIPLFIVLLFISSGETIPSFLIDTWLDNLLYSLSFPNSIVFNLSIGYLAGLFIYYLTTYIPEKRREKYQNIITLKLLKELHSRMSSIDKMVIKCSTESIEEANINEVIYKLICKHCSLSSPSGPKKLISSSPLVVDDISVRENLINSWNQILKTLNKIDFAAIYISPDLYELTQRVRHSSFGLTLDILHRQIANENLEAFSSSLYELRQLSNELQRKIKE